MCLGVPHQVIEVIDPDTALVRIGSGVQRCFVGLLEPLQIGDWVVVHAGLAIEHIAPDDARKNLDLIRQLIQPSQQEEVEARVRAP
jgi:hydrogenase expression/formation protein HypC